MISMVAKSLVKIVTPSNRRWFSVDQRVTTVAKEQFPSFETFKEQQFETEWKSFKDSFLVQQLLKSDTQKALESFHKMCRSRYNRLKQQQEGGNPGLMI